MSLKRRRSFLKTLGMGLAGFPFITCQQESIAKPNFVIIIADDMAWNDCGAYGHPSIRTPNIDRLAKEGMRFTHAFLTSSSCSPSRSSIFTGKYPHNIDAEQLHWPLPNRIRPRPPKSWFLRSN